MLKGVIQSTISWLLASLITVSGAYFAVETWVDGKVYAVEKRVIETVTLMRERDMEVIKSIKEDTFLIKQKILGEK